MTKPTEENRELARSIAKILGGTPSVREYFDDDKVATINIMTCTDAPQDAVNSYSTLALSDVAVIDAEGDGHNFGIEIVAACETDAEQFVNALSTCAFNIIKDGTPVYPGVVFPRVLDLYEGLSSTLSHAFLVDPFLWGEELSSRKMGSKTVAFLQMIPISDSEYTFLQKQGPEALEEQFEKHQIDIFDINREPVV
ncbi:suppressor of fused domain protein [Rhizobium deserti]|uniref:Suppressor of fused domain protein n=1 Tax=Rhizobium deserti TaxID=2547961 RepID=A0A4R5UAR8_9HYPH|nr:suppressor of fused domain protein [Rhizobium deserti]TDK32129.1 suppressor of fused domain protein [Rhizobium deserti]